MEKRKSVGRIISQINRFTHIHINNELSTFRIGIGQLHFLMKLYNDDGINQESLAQYLKTDKATSARAIKKLKDEGFLIRKKDKSDKRAYKIFLTKKAKDLRPKIRKITRKWTETLLTDFNEEEKKLLFSFLERIAQNAELYK